MFGGNFVLVCVYFRLLKSTIIPIKYLYHRQRSALFKLKSPFNLLYSLSNLFDPIIIDIFNVLERFRGPCLILRGLIFRGNFVLVSREHYIGGGAYIWDFTILHSTIIQKIRNFY